MKEFFPKIEKAINGFISSFTNELQTNGINAGKNHLSKELVIKGLAPAVSDMYVKVGVKRANIDYRDMKREAGVKSFELMEQKGFGFNPVWVQFINDYLQKYLLDKITFNVATNLRDRMLEKLNQMITEGQGVDEMVRSFNDWPYSRYAAERIVRTEVNRASNVGTVAAADSFPYEQQKRWSAAHDKRTRGNPMNGLKDHADHWSLDGQVVDFEMPFYDPRNGHEMMHPGDPNAAAEDTINCRCRITVTAKRNERGRLIPKQQRVFVQRNFNRSNPIITI